MPTLTQTEVVRGPAWVSLNGVQMGLTEKDVQLVEEFENAELTGGQSVVVGDYARTLVRAKIVATFKQLSLEKMQYLCDWTTAPVAGVVDGKWSDTPTQFALELLGPGSNRASRLFTATAVLLTPGTKIFDKGVYTGAPVEFGLVGDMSENKYYHIVETAASASVPAVASTQKITAAGVATTLTDGDASIPVDDSFQFTYNVAVLPTDLSSDKFILKTNDGNTAVACTVGYGTTASEPDYTKVVITPAANLSAGTEYELVAVSGVRSFAGLASAALAALQFTTAS